MENTMVLDDKAKARIGMICFLPIIAFALCLVYYIMLLLPLTQGHPEPGSVVGITSRNYDTLFLMLATSAIITAPIFIYCLVLLARFKNLNSAEKVKWIVFLSVLAPIASAFFWVLIIRKMPKYVGIHPDIA